MKFAAAGVMLFAGGTTAVCGWPASQVTSATASFPTVGNRLNKILDEMRARGEVERGSSEDTRLNRQADMTTGAFAGATAFIGSLGGALIGGFVGWIVRKNSKRLNEKRRCCIVLRPLTMGQEKGMVLNLTLFKITCYEMSRMWS